MNSAGRSNSFIGFVAALGVSASALALCGGTARAQAVEGNAPDQAVAGVQGGVGDIIVTARKRSETLVESPVVIQAFSQEKLEALGITSPVALATVTPGLRLNYGTGGVGATAFLRGIGNGDASSFIDQSVLLNVDGVPLTHGAFYKSGFFDVAQVEVLKGPQSLYYGKSASAGIISVQTADPTDSWETMLRMGYEFNFDQARLEGVISGPVGEGLGVRLAAFYNDEKGYLRNANPASTSRRVLDGDEIGVRATMKVDNGPFTARAKYTFYRARQLGNLGGDNQYICAGDLPQKAINIPFDDCKVNRTTRGNPSPGTYDPVNNYATSAGLVDRSPSPYDNGKTYSDTDTHQLSLQMDYEIADGLTITSVTGYSTLKTAEAQRILQAYDIGGIVDVSGGFRKKDFSQEVRLSSDWSGGVNFIAGAFYGRGTYDYDSFLGYPAMPNFPAFGLLGPNYVHNRLKMRGETLSVFGQVEIGLARDLDLSIGARYTRDKKRWRSLYNEDLFLDGANDIFGPDGEQIGLLDPDDISYAEGKFIPEVTLRYRPSPSTMVYAAFKQGYKGPGYNGATTAYSQSPLFGTINAPFEGERVIGGELGFKGELADGQLLVTSAAYWYKYKGLQVSFVENATFQFTTKNGADAIVKGIELGLNFRPRGVEGLSLNAFVNYNDAYYDSFPEATCYSGQTAAQGCVNGVQDLSGRQLHRSPRWTGMFGFDYSRGIGSDLTGTINVNANFASDTNISPEQVPVARQGRYLTLDATATLGSAGRAWELALIGRNLTNKIYAFSGLDGGLGDGGLTGPNGPDAIAYVNRGRSIMLQLTLRPNLF